MFRIFLIKIIVTIFYTVTFSQSLDSTGMWYYNLLVVDSIKVVGNEQTKDYIVLRELTFLEGDTIDTEILAYNRDRIYSLGLFNSVELYPIYFDDYTQLVIELEETWFIYPVPFFSLRDRDWDKFSFGVSLVWRNFRGRNETVSTLVAVGYDPAYSLLYKNPDITNNDDIFINTSLSYQNVNNKSSTAQILYGEPFEQKFITANFGIGKRVGLFNKFSVNLGFNYVQTPFYIKGISVSDGRIDRIPILGFGYEYDTRDLAQYPKEGLYLFASHQFKGLGINNINYRIVNIDYRQYWMLVGDLGSKWRASTRLASGKIIPFYDFSYLGFGDRVRGYFNIEEEGHNNYLFSVELFYPIIKELDVNLDFVPIIPKELLHYKIALYTQTFADAGTTKLRGVPLTISDFNSGYGLGFTLLILPYNVLRVEYAFNELFNGELIIDLGVSF